MVDLLTAGLIVLVVILAYSLYKSHDDLKVMNHRVADRDRTIASLRREIAQREQETAQSKALFMAMSYAAYDPVFVLNTDYEIVAFDKSAQVFFGAEYPLGEAIIDVIDSPELDDIVRSTLENREAVLEEQVTIEGNMYRVQTRLMEFERNTFIGVALHDISQLVRLNRARRDMVANISHELRTPIANIRIIIDSLFHEQDKPKRKASINSLHDIAKETDTLLWLVQELLDLSMIESGQAIMKMFEVPLIEIVDQAVERLEDQLDGKDLTIVKHVPEKLNVICDMDQTKRVLVNLIHNAMKWSPDGETITITATPRDEDVVVSVLDNGPGVPDDQCDRIFERFYQVDASRSGDVGTGLGLAICKHIVTSQGGQIWAEGNSSGGGGRFLFSLLYSSPSIELDVNNAEELTRF